MSATATTQRPYRSPLREAQAAQTREQIFGAARQYLDHHAIESLTLRQIAVLSGVSAPTVYAHFPTMDDLIGAFFQWLKPRMGMSDPLPPLDELPRFPARMFRRYEEYAPLLRNLMHQPAWERQRVADRPERHGAWLAALGRQLPGLGPAQLRRGGMALSAFWTPTMWRWLIDICGFSPAEAERTAAWGVQSLIDALRREARPLADAPAAKPARKAVGARKTSAAPVAASAPRTAATSAPATPAAGRRQRAQSEVKPGVKPGTKVGVKPGKAGALRRRAAT